MPQTPAIESVDDLTKVVRQVADRYTVEGADEEGLEVGEEQVDLGLDDVGESVVPNTMEKAKGPRSSPLDPVS
jgi:hypothetical protein